MRIFTLGHSTRSLEEFLSLLRTYEITLLVDVRIAPYSRRYPHFAREALGRTLREAGIGYRHTKDLGGWRNPRADSANTGWRNAAFRGYADYMETAQFASALVDLLSEAAGHTVAIMCAEAVPWRCHRQLVADALLVRGVDVVHIFDQARSEHHQLTPFARVDGTRLIYDGKAPRRAGLRVRKVRG